MVDRKAVQSILGGHPDHLRNTVGINCLEHRLLAALYLVVLVTLGLATLRKGHYALFIIGIIFPMLWVIGALIGPTPRATAAAITH